MFNGVIDISHHQEYIDFNKLKADGIVGVIHKATQGTGYVDPKYLSRMELAKSVGLLWGAYHFGENADSKQQLNHFENVAKLKKGDLAVLDYEAYEKDQMTYEQARGFVLLYSVRHFGSFPVLYTGASFINEVLGTEVDTLLRNCPLWIAQYNNEEIKVPPTWNDWMMWQYTDGTNGNEPHYTDGAGNVDRNIFNGSQSELYQFWE